MTVRPSLLERIRDACSDGPMTDVHESVRRMALRSVREAIREGRSFEDLHADRGRGTAATRRRGESWSTALSRRVEIAIPRLDSRVREATCRIAASAVQREIRLEVTLRLDGDGPERRLEFLVVGRDVVDPAGPIGGWGS